MTTQEFKIGSTVKVRTESGRSYMMNGIVTGSYENRTYVNWPQHGSSSIPTNQLELQ